MSYTIEQCNTGGFNVLCDGQVIGWCVAPWQSRTVIKKHINANPLP